MTKKFTLYLWALLSRFYQWMHGETFVGVGISDTVSMEKSHGVAVLIENGQRTRVNIVVSKPRYLNYPTKALIKQLYAQFDKMGLRCVGLTINSEHFSSRYYPRPAK